MHTTFTAGVLKTNFNFRVSDFLLFGACYHYILIQQSNLSHLRQQIIYQQSAKQVKKTNHWGCVTKCPMKKVIAVILSRTAPSALEVIDFVSAVFWIFCQRKWMCKLQWQLERIYFDARHKTKQTTSMLNEYLDLFVNTEN